MCVCETQREREKERECVRERESVCVRGREERGRLYTCKGGWREIIYL